MSVSSAPTPLLVAVRGAHHAEATPKYDRVVFEFKGPLPLLEIGYVTHLIEDGSGFPVKIAGAAILAVQFRQAQAHDDQGRLTAPKRVALNMPLVKEAVQAGDFEGMVTYGIGIQQKAEVRISTLAGACRVVVDVIL